MPKVFLIHGFAPSTNIITEKRTNNVVTVILKTTGFFHGSERISKAPRASQTTFWEPLVRLIILFY